MVNVNKRRDPAIYALHSGDHKYFYVGFTMRNSDNRLYQHNYRARIGHPSPVYQRMREIGEGKVYVTNLQLLSGTDDAKAIEASWIRQLLKGGHPIVNELGRDGIPDSMSAAARKRVGDANRGRETWIKGKTGEEAGWTDERRAAAAERAEQLRLARVPNHGTVNEYQKYGCRCSACSEIALNPRTPVAEHGRYLYKRDKCRCSVCVEANRAYARAWKESRQRTA